MQTICAGKEFELNLRKSRLKKASSGEFQICFVIGEAGSGKTTLVNAFTDTGQKEYSDVLSAIDECDSRISVSDPYLAFKEVLAMFTGDIGNGLRDAFDPIKVLERVGEYT